MNAVETLRQQMMIFHEMDKATKGKRVPQPAVVCISSRNDEGWRGHRALWRCNEDVARLICSDQRTQGTAHMLIWFYDNEHLSVDWTDDDGRYDDVLEWWRLEKNGRDVRLLGIDNSSGMC